MIDGQDRLIDVEPARVPADLKLEPDAVPSFDEAKHKYSLGDVVLPGVTTILGVLDKPALPWWGMRTGVRGVLELFAAGALDHRALEYMDDADVVKLLTQHKLTVNHVKDAAGARGSVAHDAAEQWLKHGVAPDLKSLPDEAKKYVQSAAAFMVEVEPKPVATEVMVWSERHWYAGTFDLLAYDAKGRLGLWDYKTSKRAYDTHLLQLAAYESCRRELKLEPVEFCAVVHISNEGCFDPERHLFEIAGQEINRSIEDWLAVLKTYQAMKRREGRLKPLHRRMNPKGR